MLKKLLQKENSMPVLLFVIFVTIILVLAIEVIKLKTTPPKVIIQQVNSIIPNRYVGDFHVTHYCSCPQCTNKPKKGRTATGHIPREGRTIAADPKIIPLHSVVYVEGLGTFVVEDVGGAVKGNKIDIYVNDHAKALQLGTLGGQKKKVYVISEDN